MTICSKMLEAIDKRLEEKKSLEEIGCELCDAVDDPRGKALRIIKNYKGEQYLRDNADWLGYDVARAEGGKITPRPEKNLRSEEPKEQFDDFGLDEIVYENKTVKPVCNPEWNDLPCDSCKTESNANMCPCGCGYSYDIYSKKWRKSKQGE